MSETQKMAEAPVVDNPRRMRFEVEVDGHLAQLVYRRDKDRLVLIHTEVAEELEGRGVGGRLVTAAIDDGARNQLTVVPLCAFAAGWLERHPATTRRVRIEWPDGRVSEPGKDT